MKKIFQVANCLNLAGTETVFMNWYRYVDRSKLHFDFSVNQVYKTPLVDEILEKGGKIFIIPANVGIKCRIKRIISLYRLLKKNGPYDVFQTHSHFNCGLDCFAAFLAGIPKRFTISHMSDGYQKFYLKHKIIRPFYRLLIAIFSTNRLAVSKDAGKSLYGKYISFQLIHNGIELNKFSYNPIVRNKKRHELKLENKLVIGHVGRFTEQKNHTFLIDVFCEIHKKNPQAHLVLLGVGELEFYIKQKIKALCLENNVSFMGARTDVENFYQAFDAFLLPSLYEGLGIVAIEAQTSGLPCFMSDVIPNEAFVCNATPLSLKQSPTIWADTILNTLHNFVRKDETVVIQKAGFDIVNVGKYIEMQYLKK